MPKSKEKKIVPARVRYIKLGRGGKWEQECLKKGILRFGFNTECEERLAMCKGKKWDRLQASFLEDGKDKGTATRSANETRIFWEDEGEVLWITFIGDCLYWGTLAQAAPTPHADGQGTYRVVAGGWSADDRTGQPLLKNGLSGGLNKLAAYRGTSCELDPALANYIVRRINGEKTKEIERGLKAMAELKGATADLIRLLQPGDFELLVDLVFSGSGWRRLGVVGRTQKTTDIDLMLPSTDERALVQVKSRTTQAEFEGYVLQLSESRHYDRMFYVYHTSGAEIENTDETITVIGPEKITDMVISAGLVNWVMQKVS